MSFLKDPDAYTRGSGAIASADYQNPRRAAERRYRLENSARIDRNRARYTYGERGGIGAIPLDRLGVRRGPQLQEGGNVESSPPSTPGPGQVGSGRLPTIRTPGGKGGGKVTPPPPLPLWQVRVPVFTGGGVSSTSTPAGGTVTPPRTRDPRDKTGAIKPRPPRTVVVTPTGGSTSSGGGGGGGAKAQPPVVPWTSPPPPVSTDAGDPIVAERKIPWLLIAAAGVGAYLLYKNRKESP